MVLLIVWPILFYKLGQKNGEQLTETRSKLRIATLDWLEGFSELTLFGAEERYKKAILTEQDKLLNNQRVNAHYSGLAQALLLLFNGWTLIIILWLASDGVAGNTPDPLIALVAFATMASFELLMPIAGAFQYLGQTLTSARRLNEVILAEPDVTFPENDIELKQDYRIEFDHVDFHYPDSSQQVLKQVSLTVEAKQKVAIVGQTGSGKSTLLQLLSRYWDPNQGSISIAGVPLTQWSESQLRKSITVVSQRVDILNGTLRDNLLMANPTVDDTLLQHTLAKVGLEKLLEEQGLDAWLGEGGRQLSGGEKRRIGIARALLHNGSIVLLDEPTEGLDKKTEQKIMALFDEFLTDKTVIFITHRLVNLDKMDAICLIEQGEVVEFGHHNDLIRNQGRYHQLTQTL